MFTHSFAYSFSMYLLETYYFSENRLGTGKNEKIQSLLLLMTLSFSFIWHILSVICTLIESLAYVCSIHNKSTYFFNTMILFQCFCSPMSLEYVWDYPMNLRIFNSCKPFTKNGSNILVTVTIETVPQLGRITLM